MKKYTVGLSLLICILFSGCTTTFFGSVFLLTFRDVISYVIIALLMAVIIAITGKSGKGRELFRIWFILSLLLTPLAGLIYLLIQITKKRE